MEWGLVLYFGSKAMVEWRLAFFILGHIFPANDGDIHYPPAAGFPIKRGLLCAMPDPAVMNGEVAGAQVEADFAAIGVIVDKILFTK